MTSPTSIDPTGLPTTIRDYLAAHAAGDSADALVAFGPDAVVVDQGRTYRGADGVLDFLRSAGAEFDYTTTLVGYEPIGHHRWAVRNRLEGDFPGGIADLTYRFAIDGGRIVELVIST